MKGTQTPDLPARLKEAPKAVSKRWLHKLTCMLAEASYLCYVMESGGHSRCAIITQGVAGEDELAQPSVCIDVLCEGCGAGRPQPLTFQVQPLQGSVTCKQGRLLKMCPLPLLCAQLCGTSCVCDVRGCADSNPNEATRFQGLSASTITHSPFIAQFLAMNAHLKVPLQGQQWLHRQTTRLRRLESAGCCYYAEPLQSNGHRPSEEGDGRL